MVDVTGYCQSYLLKKNSVTGKLLLSYIQHLRVNLVYETKFVISDNVGENSRKEE